jgi:DNA/RNA-binding domain of Phe-tRNA-synthetase-like protein
MAFSPTVSDAVWERFGEYRALSITVTGFVPVQSLRPVAGSVAGSVAAWTDAHIAAWQQAFRAFGANPKRTPPSVESLVRRLRKDTALPTIHPVVDLYNAVSVGWGVPIGGEDMRRYEGSPRLVVADGTETFDTVRDGTAVLEQPEAGEIVWRDEAGVTCRRWNWRQCRRTAITERTVDFWFVLDRLPPLAIDDLRRAGDELTAALREACPACQVEVQLLAPDA